MEHEEESINEKIARIKSRLQAQNALLLIAKNALEEANKTIGKHAAYGIIKAVESDRQAWITGRTTIPKTFEVTIKKRTRWGRLKRLPRLINQYWKMFDNLNYIKRIQAIFYLVKMVLK